MASPAHRSIRRNALFLAMAALATGGIAAPSLDELIRALDHPPRAVPTEIPSVSMRENDALATASVRSMEGDYKAAREALEKILDARSSARIDFALGQTLHAEGRTSEAIERIRVAIQKAPRYPTPYRRMGTLAMQLDPPDYERAVSYLLQAYELGERDHRLLFELGMAYTSLDRIAEAKACVERAIGKAPDDARYRSYLEGLEQLSR